jgi:hypothetical protein
MKRIMKWIAGTGLVLAVLAFFTRDYLGLLLISFLMAPDHAFERRLAPVAPDYVKIENWAALPGRNDSADVERPPEIVDSQRGADVDVFFVHPTTYVSGETWNQPLDHEGANKLTDEWVMRDQASVFNACCGIYAPRYRQATLFSFQDESGSGESALNLAYEDVRSAFRFFIQNYNQRKPFILASHSQGSMHADRLLREEIVSSNLFSRMVAAYVIGFSVDESNNVPICERSDQVNCQVSWNASTSDAPIKLAQSGDICVNPITWKTDSVLALAADNLGSVTFSSEGGIDREIADAVCRNGSLFVSEVDSERYTNNMPFGPGNYHMHDYSFYYMDIRKNVEERIANFKAINPL